MLMETPDASPRLGGVRVRAATTTAREQRVSEFALGLNQRTIAHTVSECYNSQTRTRWACHAGQEYMQQDASVKQRLWWSLKRWRKLRLGPVSLVFNFERFVHVTPNTAARRQAVPHRHLPGPRMTPRSATTQVATAPDAAKQQLALIVGVGPGFGHALARRLAAEGLSVAMASRNAERLDDLVQELSAAGVSASAYGCDATDEASVTELFDQVQAHQGVPDLVVYSIQSFGPGETLSITRAAFEDGLRQNCLGSFLVARAAARVMLPRRSGTILLTGSTSSVLGRAGHLNLVAGKFAQRGLAQVLARELWPKGIHVVHLIIDADIHEGEERDDGGPQSDPSHIAQMIVTLHRQPSSAWTSEIDLRPWNEHFWEHC
jgi:NAD(P)-dependent dehydrogenase (short-subunit alcohol dehydrogenase family)